MSQCFPEQHCEACLGGDHGSRQSYALLVPDVAPAITGTIATIETLAIIAIATITAITMTIAIAIMVAAIMPALALPALVKK